MSSLEEGVHDDCSQPSVRPSEEASGSRSAPLRTYYYIDQYSDERMPCEPTLAAWAKWLSEADDDWPHDIPADGERFRGYTLEVLARINCWWEANDDPEAEFIGEWKHDPIPRGVEWFAQVYGNSWDADMAGEDLEEMLSDWFDGDDQPEFVAIRQGPAITLLYRADPPRVEVVSGHDQSAAESGDAAHTPRTDA